MCNRSCFKERKPEIFRITTDHIDQAYLNAAGWLPSFGDWSESLNFDPNGKGSFHATEEGDACFNSYISSNALTGGHSTSRKSNAYLFEIEEMHVFSIHIECSTFYIILKTCFAMKDSNTELVVLLSYYVKYLLISHISYFLHEITTERSRFGFSHLHQSFCCPMSSFVFTKTAKFIQ